jgi:hypothetical protein
VFFADKDEVELIGTNDLSIGNLNLLQEAKEAIQGTGPNAHMQGKEGEKQSGRAILAMQQAGMTEMAPLLDALRDFNLRTYRAIWNRIRQFWTSERWVRVTDDENSVKFFAVNTTQANVAMQKITEAAKEGKVDQQTAQQYMMQVQMDPQMQQPANNLAELDVDIQIDEIMNTPTLHAEQFEQLVQLATSGMFPVPPEIIIRASNLRDKQQLLDILKEQQQQQGQMGQQQQELQMRGAQAEVAKVEAEGIKTMAEAEGKVIENEMAPAKAMIDAQSQGFQQEAA